jgi:UDP-N-acetylmuramyl pentapeptide phosphotransferase/UDP-N-acetylglucosamine-1-phosphate transferase
VVEWRIKPHFEQVEEAARREAQARIYRRNQIFGVMMVAAAILGWWLWNTNPSWIFPSGWWRL